MFDGFSGSKVADFAATKFPAELCLGQVSQNSTDEAVREALRQSFTALDREYFNFIGEKLALRMAKRLEDPTDPNLSQLDQETLVGASAAIAVLLGNNRLFVANAGDVRAVVCSCQDPDQDQHSLLKAVPLSVDHLLSNEDEALRLSQLGLDIRDVAQAVDATRCLGCHQVKGGYKEVKELVKARDEPVLATPEIHGPFHVDPRHLFLMVYTKSLARSLEQIGTSIEGDVATELCRIALDQFAENTTVTGVAQSVVDKVVRMHREHFETEIEDKVMESWKREDITLLVKNFNAKLAASGKRRTTSTSLNSPVGGDPQLVTTITPVQNNHGNNANNNHRPPAPTRSSTTTESSDVFSKNSRELSVDENGKVKPYVDFTHFNQEWEKYKASKQNGVDEQ